MHDLLDGPWKLFDNYVVPQHWRPDFIPMAAKIKKMAVWVRLPGLPVEYFMDNIIKLILQRVGTPLKLDKNMAGAKRGHFAHVAVEIDLAKPLVSKVMIRRRIQYIEFEGLHAICFGCGEVVHRSTECHKNILEIAQPIQVDVDGGISLGDNTGKPFTEEDNPNMNPG